MIDDFEEGMIFGGSLTSQELSQTFIQLSEVFVGLINTLFKAADLESGLDRHFMRMSSLLEMHNAMDRVQKKEDVVKMLVSVL